MLSLRLSSITVLLICIATLLPISTSNADPVDPEIEALQKEIDANGYHWTAKRTWCTDLGPEERRQLLGLYIPPEAERRFAALDAAAFPVSRDLPSEWDWRDSGYVSSVKNQSSCGSCWDFAAIGALESVLLIAEGVEYDLSEQQIKAIAKIMADARKRIFEEVLTDQQREKLRKRFQAHGKARARGRASRAGRADSQAPDLP